jgi:hypothetical protein
MLRQPQRTDCPNCGGALFFRDARRGRVCHGCKMTRSEALEAAARRASLGSTQVTTDMAGRQHRRYIPPKVQGGFIRPEVSVPDPVCANCGSPASFSLCWGPDEGEIEKRCVRCGKPWAVQLPLPQMDGAANYTSWKPDEDSIWGKSILHELFRNNPRAYMSDQMKNGFQGEFTIGVDFGRQGEIIAAIMQNGRLTLAEQIEAGSRASARFSRIFERQSRERIQEVVKKLFGPSMPTLNIADFEQLKITGRAKEKEDGFYAILSKKLNEATWTKVRIRSNGVITERPSPVLPPYIKPMVQQSIFERAKRDGLAKRTKNGFKMVLEPNAKKKRFVRVIVREEINIFKIRERSLSGSIQTLERDEWNKLAHEGNALKVNIGHMISSPIWPGSDFYTWKLVEVKNPNAFPKPDKMQNNRTVSITQAEFDRLQTMKQIKMEGNVPHILQRKKYSDNETEWVPVSVIGKEFEAAVTGQIAKSEQGQEATKYIVAHAQEILSIDTERARLQKQLADLEQRRSVAINSTSTGLGESMVVVADEIISLLGLLPFWGVVTENEGMTAGKTFEEACQSRSNYGDKNTVVLCLDFASLYDDNEDNL